MRAHFSARLAALAVVLSFASMLTSCAETASPWSTALPGTSHLVAGVRADFARHWRELLADPSPAAARTRAEVIAWALREDPTLLAMLEARESKSALIARGAADAQRAADAFPEAADAWLSLAQIRAYAGDIEGSQAAACRAHRLDGTNANASSICRETAPTPPRLTANRGDTWASADRTAAKTLAETDLHVALRAAEGRTKVVCRRPAQSLSWAELVTCGDADARSGRRVSARARYRAAVLMTPNEEAQFLALQRIEELDGTCRDVLDLLPPTAPPQYARWKTTLAARIRPPIRGR